MIKKIINKKQKIINKIKMKIKLKLFLINKKKIKMNNKILINRIIKIITKIYY